MRLVALALIGSFTAGVAASAPQAGTGGKPAIRACSLLTKELALQVTPAANKKVLDMIPPAEESMGAIGSACEYGDIRLQIDPFPPARVEELRKQQGKDWTPVPNVGDKAYFRDNRGRFAELIVAVGAHTFTVQMGVPLGGTADAIKPNVITVANAIVPKLR
jgi:hypothetical protein